MSVYSKSLPGEIHPSSLVHYPVANVNNQINNVCVSVSSCWLFFSSILLPKKFIISSFNSWVMFHCISFPHLFPFICWQISRLLPINKQRNKEHGWTIFSLVVIQKDGTTFCPLLLFSLGCWPKPTYVFTALFLWDSLSCKGPLFTVSAGCPLTEVTLPQTLYFILFPSLPHSSPLGSCQIYTLP